MKQFFNKENHNNFKEYFSIKEKSSDIEKHFLEKIYKYIKYIRFLPWIKMVWVWNSISMNCAKKESDIDLYIVTSDKSMWLNRIIITMIFEVLKVRKTDKKHKDMFCLSFFSTLSWMDFSNFKVKNDIYLYFWIIYFKPILSIDNTYENFIKVNEKWADFEEYRKQIEKNKSFIKYEKKYSNENIITKKIDLFLRNIFIKKTIKSYEKLWKPYGIIINNNMLKFHDNDIRKKIKKELWF